MLESLQITLCKMFCFFSANLNYTFWLSGSCRKWFAGSTA